MLEGPGYIALNELQSVMAPGIIRLQTGDRFFVLSVIHRFGRIDILINNAGPYIFERKKLADYSDDEWYDMRSSFRVTSPLTNCNLSWHPG
jgi:short-subunit dehydrogenase